MDSLVLETLTGEQKSKAKLINEDNLKSSKPSSFTATIKDITKVHAIFPGRVLYIGYYEGMGTVTILVSDKEIVRYLNITNIQVPIGNIIKKNTYLGDADKKYGLQFEYCSEWQGASKMPVRLNNATYFKQNPIEIFEGLYVPEYVIVPEQGYVDPDTTSELTPEQKNEFGDYMFAIPKIDNSNPHNMPLLTMETMPESMFLETSNGVEEV